MVTPVDLAAEREDLLRRVQELAVKDLAVVIADQTLLAVAVEPVRLVLMQFQTLVETGEFLTLG
jgi:hypothetical protein